ncbi:GNAT family N-acetyltransferase [Rhizobium sp. BK376]|uniref:GNAT family N-acetyltransferase n=1 Tax=Rhizobium sp. BK376 TaxID=2512149 RepID=UPI001045DC30|nr:GNAT family N-acetyltransferase [Rhizobium sp. BK376]TCR93455.1 N-acetylglutamate synthase-like GNAT family acetyltransferase [Rhizobium sp. BK376]
MTDIAIRPFRAGDEAAVIALILPIQREEFDIAISAADQPDLAEIPAFYQSGKGQFWVAVRGDAVVGTIGLKDIGNDQAALRKMFVAAAYRGREHGVATRLLAGLLDHARAVGLGDIILGTTAKFLAAHRFYEKNGFVEISAEDLPASFPRMMVDTKFYRLRLRG